MAATAEIRIALTVTTSEGTRRTLIDETVRWAPAQNPDVRTYSVAASTFQSITIFTGAKYIFIDPKGSTSLTIKGVTGDSGCPISPSSAPIDGPICLTLGSSPTLGILNGASSTQEFEVIVS